MTDLARLRRCARILRQAHPEFTYKVSTRYNTIFQIGSAFGIPCEFSVGLEAWEAYANFLTRGES